MSGTPPLRGKGGVARRTVCLDFDGVLHAYSRGWADGTIYDPPIIGSVEAVRSLAEDFDLVISTCRDDVEGVAAFVREHYGLDVPVTNAKPPAVVYVDDRGVRFDGDWSATESLVRLLVNA